MFSIVPSLNADSFIPVILNRYISSSACTAPIINESLHSGLKSYDLPVINHTYQEQVH